MQIIANVSIELYLSGCLQSDHCIYEGSTVLHYQGLFQDFASEGANAKFQNSRGGGGNPILKGRKSRFLGGAN